MRKVKTILAPALAMVVALAVPPVAAGSGDGPAAERGYIVSVRSGGLLDRVLDLVGVAPLHAYDHVLHGFSAALTPAQVARLRRMPAVERVERNRTVHATTGWNLDRLDQSHLPLDGVYATDATGSGVTAYVIGTGIDPSRKDFEGRASAARDFVDGRPNAKDHGDCVGHGTHVAGIIGSARRGVARDVSLRGVRVLDCDEEGTTADLIAGLDWVAAHAHAPAVANVSVGGPYSASLNEAAAHLVQSGVYLTVAAGNSGKNACDESPASTPAALTVGASNRHDRVPSWSNGGQCVDVYAPGVDVSSDWGDTGTKTLSGTSMAAPHAAGVAALYIDAHGHATAATITRWIRRHAAHGVLRGVPARTPNLLLDTGDL